MTIHREGTATIVITVLFLIGLWFLCHTLIPSMMWLYYILAAFLLVTVLQFFRNPVRVPAEVASNILLAPADGKVVVIEQVYEPEFLKADAMMVSIFMSPINVHVNRNPIDAKVLFYKYHSGTYLAAWHPKSSTENERTTVVYEANGQKILVRQIAGALARRIVNYLKEGQEVKRGTEMGFIKFGSRVDIYLPLDAQVLVNLNDVVKGNYTSIAEIR